MRFVIACKLKMRLTAKGLQDEKNLQLAYSGRCGHFMAVTDSSHSANAGSQRNLQDQKSMQRQSALGAECE
jgi:hypothetical protein